MPPANLPDGDDVARAQLRLLGDVSELLSTILDQGLAVEELARLVVPDLADWCIVTLAGAPGQERDLGWAHRDPALHDALGEYARQQYDAMTPEAAVSVVLRTGKPVIVREMPPDLLDTWVSEPGARGHLGELAPAAVAVLPLTSGNQTLGAIALVTLKDREPLTTEQLDVAREVARRAGLALDNARLYSEQRHLAETLQRSLLTQPPRTEDLDIAVRYSPAAATAQVGGDWYDAFHQPSGALVLAIGDVVGHDSEAAAAMGQLRSLLRGIAYTVGCRPAALLTRLDEAVVGLRLGTNATVAVVQLAESGQLTWSNAGHPPGMVVSDGLVRLLGSPEADLILGVDPATDRHEYVDELPQGGLLVLYTDGLVERRGVDLDDGLQQLQLLLASTTALSADEVCDLVLSAMLTPEATDDVAILVARRL